MWDELLQGTPCAWPDTAMGSSELMAALEIPVPARSAALWEKSGLWVL